MNYFLHDGNFWYDSSEGHKMKVAGVHRRRNIADFLLVENCAKLQPRAKCVGLYGNTVWQTIESLTRFQPVRRLGSLEVFLDAAGEKRDKNDLKRMQLTKHFLLNWLDLSPESARRENIINKKIPTWHLIQQYNYRHYSVKKVSLPQRQHRAVGTIALRIREKDVRHSPPPCFPQSLSEFL